MSRTGSAAKALLARVYDRWLEVFFADGSSFDLAVSRLLFFGGLSLLYRGTDFRPWANVSPVFWMPISLFKILGIGVAPFPVLGVFQLLWKVCLVFLCLGFLTRASAAVAAVLGFYLLGLQNSMGKTDHFDAIVVFVCLIFAVAKPTPEWSVDGWLRKRFGKQTQPSASAEYTWPVRAVWLLLALIFFAAGVSKLRHGGIAWITSENMAVMLVKQHYWASAVDPPLDWGLWIASHSWLTRLMAAGIIIIEICYPLAILSTRLRIILVPAMLLTQIGIFLVMGPFFSQFVLANVFWVPWDRVSRWLAAKVEG